MKVVCDNCSAVYKVPDEKLTKPVNKATCRQCGHRMLIPRPRVDADPNERTLVTAVPPTPMGAPPRDVPWTPNTSSRPERTLPGRPAPAGFSPSLAGEEVPVFPGTPMPMSARRQAPSAAAIQSIAHGEPSPDISLPPQPSRRPSLAAQPTAPAPASASRGLPSSGPMPSPLQQQPTMPAPNRRSPSPSISGPPAVSYQQAPRPNSVAPPTGAAPPSQTSTAVPPMARGSHGPNAPLAPLAPVHDPSTDLTIALAGVFGSLAGVFVLALLSVWPWRSVLWMGLTIAIGGSITAILVLITSQRGTRPAWVPTSLLTGGILAVALSTGIVSTHFVGERLVELDLGQLAKISFVSTPDTTLPVEPAQPIAPKPETEPEPETAPPEPKAEPEQPKPKPERPKPERPRPERPKPRPEPVRPAPVRPAPVPAPRPAPVPAPVVAPPPVAPPAPVAPAPAASVSFEVIDVMLRNNLPVKKCFYDFGQSTGQLPPRVDVNFNLMPTGSVTGVNIRQAQYKGSPLESCLGGAIRNVKFPPSSGNGQKIVYPFVLQ